MKKMLKKISVVLILAMIVGVFQTGEVFAESKYDHIDSFSEGLAMVRIGDEETEKYGFIDKEGKEVVKPKYDYAEPFSEGLAMVKKDGKQGFIDKEGKEVVKPKYDQVDSFSEGLAVVEKDGKYGI